MVDTSKTTIEKLNKSNYQVWKYKMELVLIKEGIWDVVDEEPPELRSRGWLRKNNKARATIGLSVEDNQFIHIKRATSAYESWMILKNRHEKPTLSNKISLLKRICNLNMTENDDMEEHINEMNGLVEQLANLGEELGEHLVIAMLLRSIPDSYDSLINVLENKPEEELTNELVIGKLIDESKRRMELKLFNKSSNERYEEVLKISSNGYKPKRCLYCDKPGHLKPNCFAFKKHLEFQKQAENEKKAVKESECTNLIMGCNGDDSGEEFLF